MDLFEARREALRTLIDSRFGGSQSSFAQETKISATYVSRMLKGPESKDRKRIGDQVATRIEEALNLQTGHMLNPINTSRVERARSGASNAEPAGSPATLRAVRVIGVAKLGDDGHYEQDVGDGWVDAYSSDPEAYALRVKGDSMHPAIRHGSVVVVEPNGRRVPGEYVAIALADGRKMVKELVFERPDEVVIESVNGQHRQTLDLADILQIHPVAAVVAASKWRPG